MAWPRGVADRDNGATDCVLWKQSASKLGFWFGPMAMAGRPAKTIMAGTWLSVLGRPVASLEDQSLEA